MQIPFNLELGVFGGLITPVCSYILSEGFSVHSTEYRGLTLPCVVLCCRLRALPVASSPGSPSSARNILTHDLRISAVGSKVMRKYIARGGQRAWGRGYPACALVAQ